MGQKGPLTVTPAASPKIESTIAIRSKSPQIVSGRSCFMEIQTGGAFL